MSLDGFRGAINFMPRVWKRGILLCFDTVALSGVVWLAYSARLGEVFIPNSEQVLLMIAAPLIALPVFVRFGLYRAVIRYLPERAIWTIVQATALASLLWVVLVFLTQMSGIEGVPRSIPLLYWTLSTIVIAGSRYAMRRLLSGSVVASGQVRNVLIYGAGAAGRQLAEVLKTHGDSRVVGFLDDDPSLQGADVAGIRIYAPETAASLIDNLGIRQVIISIRSLSSDQRRAIVSKLARHPVETLVLPSIADIATGRYAVSQLRRIDIDDLLGRSPVPARPELLRGIIEGRAILVTGAGGSIGSELCRLISRLDPARLVMLEANEHALYRIDHEMNTKADFGLVPVLGSIGDRALLDATLRDNGVEIVYHAAAHKHVPLIEANVIEGVRNNVLGTQTLAEAAFAAGVGHFVLISSDKSVHPSNVMGATKRWAEHIIAGYAARAAGKGQRFCAVRFGNVLGSNGSVIPLFQGQIESGGPVTLTDERMTRYFMSIHEAVELIVQASALSKGGEIFLLEMGDPVRIRDVAENMIRLAGLTVRSPENPDGDIEVAVIGARPGEKLNEELFYDPSNALPTAHAKILRECRNGGPETDVADALAAMRQALDTRDEQSVRKVLFGRLCD